VPFLSDSVRIRSIKSFPEFSTGESPPQVPAVSGLAASLNSVIGSTKFENLVFQRAQGTWHAMRDGETLRAEVASIIELIRENIEE